MLVLTRKQSQGIVLVLADGRKLEIVVSKVSGNQVKLVIDAPLDVAIARKELKLRERTE